jgi:enoyl-CoA hydratase/carnithine racemase
LALASSLCFYTMKLESTWVASAVLAITFALSNPETELAPTGELAPRSGYGTITLGATGNVTRATISNPPINLFDFKLATDMYNFLESLIPGNSPTPPPKVVIFDSANPDFYIAHFDFSTLLPPPTSEKAATANLYIACTTLLQNITSTIFIGQVNGRAFGAGDELLVQMDMRFAGPGTRLGSLEIGLGQLHGVGGLQFLDRLINRGRAAEYLLTGNNIDGSTAASLGWVNRYHANVSDLTTAVNTVAQRIALFPLGGINATKVGLNANNPSPADLAQDLDAVLELGASAEGQALIQKFMVLSHNQTRSPFELGLDDTLTQLYQ